MDPELTKLIAGGSVIGGLALALYLFTKEIIVTGATYRRKCEDEARERERAVKAEQRLIDTIPTLTNAYEQITRVPQLTVKAVEAVAKVGTNSGGRQE